MKEFVLVNAGGIVVERASQKANLSKFGDPNLVLIEQEGDFLVGDKIQDGVITKVVSDDSERGKKKKEKDKQIRLLDSLREKLKKGKPLDDDEIDILLKARGA